MKYCCVPQCRGFGGHKFPKSAQLQLQWRVAIKRIDPRTKALWVPNENAVVCHRHFNPSDYRTTLMGDRPRLKDDAVPSIFAFKTDEMTSPRSERMAKRKRNGENVLMSTEQDVASFLEISSNEVKESAEVENVTTKLENLTVDVAVQCNLNYRQAYTIESFETDDPAIQYYTGFSHFSQFMMFFNLLGPAAFELEPNCTLLHPKDQLFLTLIKLRQCKEDYELSLLFKISVSTVSRVITTWINFLYFQLKELDLWPSREVIDEYMPSNFGHKFPATRVILDATEIPIQKPSNVEDQRATWSSYKHRNTVKTMIGCTPKGAVSFISDVYGGSTSDRQIIERSDLVKPDKKMFQPGDSIMADRGIMVQDLFAARDVHVNTPTMLTGRSQLEPEELVKDRRVSSKRIHIERVIGLAKSYKILKQEIPQSKTQMSSRIVYVCFSLANFRNSIVDKYMYA